MASVRIQLDLSVPSFAFRGMLALALTLLGAEELVSETVTLTTYYPAPSGVYTQMITTDNTWLARDTGRVGIGVTGSPLSKLDVNGGLALGGYAAANAAPANGAIISGNVGIGTPSPGAGAALNVNGKIVAGAQGGPPGNEPFSSIGGFSGISLEDRVGGNVRWVLFPSGGSLNMWSADPVLNPNPVQFGPRGYIKINQKSADCAGQWTNADEWGTLCGGAEYTTWTPGLFVEGWSQQTRGGTSLDSTGEAYVYCCLK